MFRLAEKSKGEVFSRRATSRVNVKIPVLCHDNANLWKGACENLSEGGALVLVANPALLPGSHIHLHFRATNNGEDSFNVVAEILTKRLTKAKIHHDSEIYYAVKFIQVQPVGQNQINKWVQEKLKDNKESAERKGA
jgi:c-di-GMP-binding flagellar brake protein YcgR